MIVLQIEHKVPDFEGWKKAFENDPIDRKKSGVVRYKIYRKVNDPDYVVIDLEFETQQQAESALASLQNLWKQVEGKVMFNPETRFLDNIESREV